MVRKFIIWLLNRSGVLDELEDRIQRLEKQLTQAIDVSVQSKDIQQELKETLSEWLNGGIE